MKSRYLMILKITSYTIYDDAFAFSDNQNKCEYNS